MLYNWQLPDWPRFRYELAEVQDDLLAFAEKAGHASGLLKGLPDAAQTQALVDVMIAEAIKTSAIEGEYLSRADVVSSIRNQLGLNPKPERVRDLSSKGAAELVVAVRNSWADALEEQTLLDWHRALMQGSRGFASGVWRSQESPMQVVSLRRGAPVVHFEAPPSARVPREMAAFVKWFNESARAIRQAPVRAALAHLYFESIHPFEDGNGRIGRAVAEKALSQSLGRPALLSLSRTIEADKKAYYKAIGCAQRSNEATAWIRYFVSVALAAQSDAEMRIDFVLRQAKFFDRYKDQLADRQLRVVRRMLDEGPDGFEGGLNARKYVSIAGVSKSTATRDLQHLVEQGILAPLGAGRSARYALAL